MSTVVSSSGFQNFNLSLESVANLSPSGSVAPTKENINLPPHDRLLALRIKKASEVKLASDAFEQTIKQQIWKLTRPDSPGYSDRVIQAHYFSELAKNLPTLSQAERTGFLQSLFSRLIEEPRQVTKHFVEGELFKVLRYTNMQDRVELFKFVMNNFEGRWAIYLSTKILKESKSVKELKSIISELVDYQPIIYKYKILREVMAIAKLQPRLLYQVRYRLPNKVAENKNCQVIRKRLRQINTWLKEQHKFCSESKFSQTAIAQDYRNIFKHAEAVVKQIVSQKAVGDKSQRQEVVDTMREQYNALRYKLRLECEIAICLRSRKVKRGQLDLQWDKKAIRDFAKVYRQLPDLLLITTPGFYSVELAETLPEDEKVVAYVADDGQAFFSKADMQDVTERERAKDVGRKNPIPHTAAHELGHSLQIQLAGHDPYLNSTGELLGAHVPRYDFNKFLKLGGWTIFAYGFKISSFGALVEIDGKSYRQKQEVFFRGQIGRFSHDNENKLLYFVETGKKENPIGSYWLEDPWEAWAEVFSQYMRVSKLHTLHDIQKLAVPADLLRHFEDLFGINDNNAAFQDYIATASPGLDIRAELLQHAVELFKRLELLSQAMILSGLLRKVSTQAKIPKRDELVNSLINQHSKENIVAEFETILKGNPKLYTQALLQVLNTSAKDQALPAKLSPKNTDFTQLQFNWDIT